MKFVNRLALVTPLLVSFAFTAQQSAGFAAAIGAEEATKLLARSQSLEENCKFLTASQSDELAAFVAKAEIAMVAKSSAASAKSLIAEGRAQGRSAPCSDSEHADVVSIINAAHRATSNSAQMVAKIKPVLEPVAPNTSPKKIAVGFVKVDTPDRVKPIEKKAKIISARIVQSGGLSRYAALTQRYYLARKCNSMSFASITSLYKDVVATHKNAVASFGVPTVKSVMSQSASKATGLSCS